MDRYLDGLDRETRAAAVRRARFLADRGLTRELPDERDLHDFLGDHADRPAPFPGARQRRTDR